MRKARLLAAVCALIRWTTPSAAEGTGRVFVSNEKSDTITLLDGGTDTVIGTIEVCGRPRDMEWNADQTLFYVAWADDNVSASWIPRSSPTSTRSPTSP